MRVFVHRTPAFLKTLIAPFSTLLWHWINALDPIFHMEAASPMPLPDLKARLLNIPVIRFLAALWEKVPSWGRFAIIMSGFFLVWQTVFTSFMFVSFMLLMLALLLFALPFVPWLWRIPVVLSAAMPVAREVERRRWLVLRSTPPSTREIILALHAGGTYRVVRVWSFVSGVRLVFLVLPLLVSIVGFVISILKVGGALLAGQAVLSRFDCLDWSVRLICIVYILVEPFIDVAVDGMLGILASTYSHTLLRAMLNSFVLRVGLWGLQVFSLLLFLPLARQTLTLEQVDSVPVLLLMGPAYGIFLGFAPAIVGAMVFGVAVLRVLFMQVLLRLALWRAELIGA